MKIERWDGILYVLTRIWTVGSAGVVNYIEACKDVVLYELKQ